MKISEIHAQGFYAKDDERIRHIIGYLDDDADIVIYDEVFIKGQPVVITGKCLKTTLARWATRIATPEEERTVREVKQNTATK